GTVSILLPSGSMVPMTNPEITMGLEPIADANGRFVGGHQRFGSSILTPLGIPIERWEAGVVPFGVQQTLTPSASGAVYSAAFSLTQPIPDELPDGLYRTWIVVHWPGAQSIPQVASGQPEWAMYTLDPGRVLGPTVRVGNPAAPKLSFFLLSD